MSLRNGVIIVVVLVLGFALLTWKRSTTPAETPAPAPAAEAPDQSSGALPPGHPDVSGGNPSGGNLMPQIAPPEPADPGIAWTRPRRWMNEIAGSMRYATYIVPGASADLGAECAVYYFGPGKGGPVEDNLERWIGEFSELQQHDVTTRQVAGMKISEVVASGSYAAHGMQGDDAGEHANWTLLGAIVEGPSGNVFFKLTGPTSTVTAARKDFDSMLGSLHRK
ncbi:MAG TPA: hypothetical protein VMJ70_00140 [Candidatus Sulfotelmatobacter sp.]|nr:hypothetical protein [Candidatus Sulfotelmatobacter sp.]